jgi:hypothetical protein
MKENGDVEVLTRTGGSVLVESSTNSLKTSTAFCKTTTAAGTSIFGAIKRLVSDPIRGTGKVVKLIQSLVQATLTEYKFRLYETVEEQNTVLSLTPLVEVTVGTVVDADGTVVNKTDGASYLSAKEVTVQVKLKSGIRIDIDKAGRVSIVGAIININSGSVDATDADIALGLETNDASLGTRGQHIAREHDKVTIPLAVSYTDTEHASLTTKNGENLSALRSLVSSIIAPSGGGPCTLVLTGDVTLVGEITEGAKDMYVGGSGS